MWVVKSNFFKQNANNKLEEYPMESGQLWGLVVAAQSKQIIAGNGEWNTHEELVEVYPKDTLLEKENINKWCVHSGKKHWLLTLQYHYNFKSKCWWLSKIISLRTWQKIKNVKSEIRLLDMNFLPLAREAHPHPLVGPKGHFAASTPNLIYEVTFW